MSKLQQLKDYLGLTADQIAADTGYNVATIRNYLSKDILTDTLRDVLIRVYNIDEGFFDGTVGVEYAVKRTSVKEMDYSVIGERIMTMRAERLLAARALGEKCGVTHSLIRRVENGKQISWNSLEKIANGLDVSVEWLSTGEGRKHDKVDQKMIDYINQNNVLRRVIWGMMEEDEKKQ